MFDKISNQADKEQLVMKQNEIMMNTDLYFSDETRAEIAHYVHRYMHCVRKGEPLRNVLADILCVGETPEENAAMPDFFMDGFTMNENDAYLAADYIIRRVTVQSEVSAAMHEDFADGLYQQLDALVDDLDLSNPKELYLAIQRTHQLNEALRIVIPCVEKEALQLSDQTKVGEMLIPAYKGQVTPEALEDLRNQAAHQLDDLKLSYAVLHAFMREMQSGGSACVTSAHYAKDSVALKAISSAVIFSLSRTGSLPEIMDDVTMDGVTTMVGVYCDVQCISDTVRLGQKVYDTTVQLIDGAVAASILGLLVVSIKSGALDLLIVTLLAHPVTLVLCALAVCVALPHIQNKLSELTEKAGMKAADFAIAHEGMTFGDYMLPPLKNAGEKLVQVLSRVIGKPADQPAEDAAQTKENKLHNQVVPTARA